MKPCISLIFLSFTSVFVLGQQLIDTSYFDANWKKASKENYSYYRIIKNEGEGKLICQDYWKTGEIQMKGVYSSMKPKIRNGEFIYYYKNGNIKEISSYINDKPSTLTKLFKEDGTLDLLCAGSLEMLDNADEINNAIINFTTFVERKLIYPEDSRKRGIQGKVLIAFFINQDGLPYRVNIAKSINDELDNEAIRIINLYKWPSPIYKAEKTSILVILPVTYILMN
jgi:periplasmic protein TonB